MHAIFVSKEMLDRDPEFEDTKGGYQNESVYRRKIDNRMTKRKGTTG
jgi:hypothetical protein